MESKERKGEGRRGNERRRGGGVKIIAFDKVLL